MHFSLSKERIAVTGATGFIGIHVLHGLYAAGAEIIAIVVAGRSTEKLETLPFPVEIIVVDDPTPFARSSRSS
jgi:nucleoside-diphosphate-sugar epimerase